MRGIQVIVEGNVSPKEIVAKCDFSDWVVEVNCENDVYFERNRGGVYLRCYAEYGDSIRDDFDFDDHQKAIALETYKSPRVLCFEYNSVFTLNACIRQVADRIPILVCTDFSRQIYTGSEFVKLTIEFPVWDHSNE